MLFAVKPSMNLRTLVKKTDSSTVLVVGKNGKQQMVKRHRRKTAEKAEPGILMHFAHQSPGAGTGAAKSRAEKTANHGVSKSDA